MSLGGASKVVVVGGIHGNEMSGVYAVKNWLNEGSSSSSSSSSAPPSLQRAGLDRVRVTLANPLAVEKCLRFVHSDLNAAFDREKMIGSAEKRRGDAEAVDNEAEIAPHLCREFEGSDFCVHLHGASSNSDVLFLVSKADTMALKVALHVKRQLTSPYAVRVLLMEPRPTSLRSLFAHGIGIEVGPQPQGMLLSEMLCLHKEVTNLVLDGLSLLAMDSSKIVEESIDVFEPVGVVPFPRDQDGELTAAIHPDFQGKDFQLLQPKSPIFKGFGGHNICHDGEATYPVFINEAAYYSRNAAFMMTRKIQIKLS